MQGACSDLSSTSPNPLSIGPPTCTYSTIMQEVYIPSLMNYVPYVTWKNLTLYVSLKHGSAMTLPILNAPFMDTNVLDATETDMVEELLCLYLTN